jgi:hypothetical protein
MNIVVSDSDKLTRLLAEIKKYLLKIDYKELYISLMKFIISIGNNKKLRKEIKKRKKIV